MKTEGEEKEKKSIMHDRSKEILINNIKGIPNKEFYFPFLSNKFHLFSGPQSLHHTQNGPQARDKQGFSHT